MRRVMIAGTGSGCGKTTVTCALLAGLKHAGKKAAAFKCGPDYIDPMFHREVLGTPAYNLDSFFCNRDTLCALLAQNGASAEISVMEGAMGFYDGGSGSAYSLSQLTETPVILVIDCKGMQDSIGAVMQGFLQYKTPNRIAGFIFNRLPERLIPFAEQLCRDLHTRYFGCLPQQKQTIGSRHLGLVTAAEITDLQAQLDALGQAAAASLDLAGIASLPDLPLPDFTPPVIPKLKKRAVIAAARDRAFCFQYTENLNLLSEIGCELRYFSPLHDAHLPAADGLLLCGGYPELYAEQLSGNQAMRAEIREAVRGGMPVIAECGGFLYLHTKLRTEDGTAYPMADVIRGEAFPAGRLTRFGYITMTAAEDQLLCAAGHAIRAHEFHYWDSTACGEGFAAVKPDGRSWHCAHVSRTMYAGFPHLYLYSDIPAAFRFAEAAAQYGEQHGTHQQNPAG